MLCQVKGMGKMSKEKEIMILTREIKTVAAGAATSKSSIVEVADVDTLVYAYGAKENRNNNDTVFIEASNDNSTWATINSSKTVSGMCYGYFTVSGYKYYRMGCSHSGGSIGYCSFIMFCQE